MTITLLIMLLLNDAEVNNYVYKQKKIGQILENRQMEQEEKVMQVLLQLYLHTALIRTVDFKIMTICTMEAKQASSFTCYIL